MNAADPRYEYLGVFTLITAAQTTRIINVLAADDWRVCEQSVEYSRIYNLLERRIGQGQRDLATTERQIEELARL